MKCTARRKTKLNSFVTLLVWSTALLVARCEAVDQTNERPIYFGAVGLANLQTARLNVVSIGDPSSMTATAGRWRHSWMWRRGRPDYWTCPPAQSSLLAALTVESSFEPWYSSRRRREMAPSIPAPM